MLQLQSARVERAREEMKKQNPVTCARKCKTRACRRGVQWWWASRRGGHRALSSNGSWSSSPKRTWLDSRGSYVGGADRFGFTRLISSESLLFVPLSTAVLSSPPLESPRLSRL